MYVHYTPFKNFLTPLPLLHFGWTSLEGIVDNSMFLLLTRGNTPAVLSCWGGTTVGIINGRKLGVGQSKQTFYTIRHQQIFIKN